MYQFDTWVLLGDRVPLLLIPNEGRDLPVGMRLSDGKKPISSNVAGCPCSSASSAID